MLEDSLSIAPRHEWSLFCNREKFDLVVLYDDASESFGTDTSPLSQVTKVIYEKEFRKNLKRMPVLLVGGINAWKRDFGGSEVVGDGSGAPVLSPSPKKTMSPGIAPILSPSLSGMHAWHHVYT